MEEQLGTKEDRPAVSSEEYAELRNMQAQLTFLQSQGYQAYQFIKQLDSQYLELTKNYEGQKDQATNQLHKLEEELANANKTFQERFKSIISQYGFENVTAVNIEETDPHYISLIPNPVAPEDTVN